MVVRKASVVLTLVLAVAGLVTQAGFLADRTAEALDRPPGRRLDAFLDQAARRLPPGAPFAVTNPVREPHVRYALYPRKEARVRFGGDEARIREQLRAAGVRYVVAVRPVPEPLLGERPWFRVLVQSEAGRLLEVRP